MRDNSKMENKMRKITVQNKTNVFLHGIKPEGKLSIEVDKNNTPLDRRFRRRLKDAKTDGCFEIVNEEKKKIIKQEVK